MAKKFKVKSGSEWTSEPTPEAPVATEAEDENPLSWLSPFPWWLLLLIVALMIVLIIATRRLIRQALSRGIRGA